MREAVLLKIPGVEMAKVEQVTNFINGDANRPIDDITAGPDKFSEHQRYVTLLGAEMGSSKTDPNPGYRISLQILTEYGVRDNRGGTEAQTPRSVINEIFDRIGIFPGAPNREKEFVALLEQAKKMLCPYCASGDPMSLDDDGVDRKGRYHSFYGGNLECKAAFIQEALPSVKGKPRRQHPPVK